MLKAKYATQAEIPANVAEYYEERGGEWLLKVEGLASEADIARLNTSLTAERTAHRATKDQLTGLTTKVNKLGNPDTIDFDVLAERNDAFDDLTARANANAHGQTETQIQERIRAATDSARKTAERKQAEAEARATAAETKATEAEQKLVQSAVTNEVRAEAAKQGVAGVDALLLFSEKQGFTVHEDGTVSTEDGIKVSDWIGNMKSQHPYLWPASVGANSEGGKGGEQGADNPWTAEGWNVTNQGKIYSGDRAKAERMAKAAGVDVNATAPKKKVA
jgi:hypothetical protein